MKTTLWRVLSGKILAQGFSTYSTTIGKRVREEESKGKASCPEKKASRYN
jgi:hypothetical protein